MVAQPPGTECDLCHHPRGCLTGSRSDKKLIVVGMSGGVDSSVTAALLREAGHEVIGATMRIWDGEPAPRFSRRQCCYGPDEAKADDVRRVARELGIVHYEFNLATEYREHVLAYFREEYARGRTPNPCMVCNQRVKFGFLVDRLTACGLRFDLFATGHYARVVFDPEAGRFLLKRGLDRRKDQSYFLAFLSQAQLARVIFPLGERTKEEVRLLACRMGLSVAGKKDSQDFADAGHPTLFEQSPGPGPILDDRGREIGKHRGIHRYTIGQRRGLAIGSPHPLYVLAIDAGRNAIIVGPREQARKSEFVAEGVNWVEPGGIAESRWVRVKIRHNHPEARAAVTALGADRVRVVFDEPQFAITPGQAAVFYDSDTVIGAGTISTVPGEI